MTFGAQAAWIEERPGQESDANALTEKAYPGQGRNWLAAVWIECQVVALFDADESQVALNPATVPLQPLFAFSLGRWQWSRVSCDGRLWSELRALVSGSLLPGSSYT
jgi:hypothetical protein